MKKRAPSLASNHYTFRVGPPEVRREPSGAGEPIPAGLLRAIECSIKGHLLKQDQEQQGFEITATGLRPVCFVIRRFGQTALVAGVLRGDDNRAESLTICCAGMDNEEDEQAIAAASELILQDGTREFVDALFEQVREQLRPLAVHIHLDEESFDDPAVRIVTHCLAESFFDQFGIEKSLHAAV